MRKEIKTIAVCGAGTMGSGIAQVFACAGYPVMVFDQSAAALHNAENYIKKNLELLVSKDKMTLEASEKAFNHISYVTDLSKVQADFILEAIVEDLSAKQHLFRQLSTLNPDAIMATNTSTIPVTSIAKGLSKPERVIGVHFFNPAPMMKLVEVISGVQTDTDLAHHIIELIQSCGKKAISVKDAPGFIVNRVARPFYTESQKIAEEQMLSIQSIDQLLESSGFKMGPFKLMDLIGNDVNFAVTCSLYSQFHQEPRFRPSRIQEQLVCAGRLGRKSGQGFYSYE